MVGKYIKLFYNISLWYNLDRKLLLLLVTFLFITVQAYMKDGYSNGDDKFLLL